MDLTGRGSPALAHKKKRSIAGITLVKDKAYSSNPNSPMSMSGIGLAEMGPSSLPSPKNRRLDWALTAETAESFGSSDSLDLTAASQRGLQRPNSAGTMGEFSNNSFLPTKGDMKRLTFFETVALFQSFTIGMRKDLMELFSEWSVPTPANMKRVPSPLPADRLLTPGHSGVVGIQELSSSTLERVVTTTNLIQFMETQQHESCSTESAKEIIQQFESDPLLRSNYLLSYEGFAAFMNDATNFGFQSEHLKPTDDDMQYPLSHYYIASSHNTYLTGHQLKGMFLVS